MTATTPETTVETLPYKNPDLPASERIADLLSRMTLEEKVGQMMQLDARGGDLDELIVNKHVGSILHTSPRGPAARRRNREHQDPSRHPTRHRRRLHPRLLLLAPAPRSSPPSSAWR